MACLLREDLPHDHVKNGGKKWYMEFNHFLHQFDQYTGFVLWQLDRDQSHPAFEEAVMKIIKCYHSKQLQLSMYFWRFLVNRKHEDDFHVETMEERIRNRQQRIQQGMRSGYDFSFVHRQYRLYQQSQQPQHLNVFGSDTESEDLDLYKEDYLLLD